MVVELYVKVGGIYVVGMGIGDEGLEYENDFECVLVEIVFCF